jgi:hypothetical protein
MNHSGFALRFLSGKYQGGEFPLPSDRKVVVGRASDHDKVLVEDMVSRRHAQIMAVDGGLMIQDLGSTNGTFVNGEKIQKARVQEGDRILIGTSILKVVSGAGVEVTAKQAREQLAAAQQAHRTTTLQMEGELSEVPIPDLLQLFATSKRTGMLHVVGPLGDGKIYLRDGNIFYASIDDDHDLGPMKALCRLVGWDEGQFQFEKLTDQDEFMLELEDSTENLLAQALHQLEEFRRVAPDLPEPTARLMVARPLHPLLSALSATELDVFQLVMNHQVVQLVFDRSPATDYETATALLSLSSRDYVRPQS